MNLVSNAYVSTSALYTCDPYLAHHGIKGQKWGVRRFQNEDGSLKAAGEKRYGVGEGVARRALAGVYSINEKAYNRLGNKTLASMNKAAKERQLALAKKADPHREERVAARNKAVKDATQKVYRHEVNRGHELGKHAILRAGVGYALRTPINAIGAAAAGAGALYLTKNATVAAAASATTFTAFQAMSTIRSGRNALDRALYLSDRAYNKHQSKKNG